MRSRHFSILSRWSGAGTIGVEKARHKHEIDPLALETKAVSVPPTRSTSQQRQDQNLDTTAHSLRGRPQTRRTVR